MNKDENCFLPDGRQDSALNLTTNGTGSISMSVELNGVVYTGEQLLCNLKWHNKMSDMSSLLRS